MVAIGTGLLANHGHQLIKDPRRPLAQHPEEGKDASYQKHGSHR
jgi:hypothetical protein